MSTYADFLTTKAARVPIVGPEISADEVHPFLHPWQRELVAWAVHVGRAALWADTGLGKTLMQLEWARLSGARTLVVAPLAVCAQTVREAAKIDLTPRYLREDDGQPGIVVTNYEMVDRFDATTFDAVVLDESSILKDFTSKTRSHLIEQFAVTERRLACTATPAPNDASELTNHAEFLGVTTRREMLATYFVHDDQGWRLKGHARAPMYAWMSTWAAAVRKPSDLGHSDEGYDLPGLHIRPHLVTADIAPRDGELVAVGLGGVSGRAQIRRATMADRCARAAELVAAEPDEPWLLWCGLNDEAELLARLTGAVNITGSMTPEAKAEALLGFADGTIPRIVTKPGIASQGLNFQHCPRMAFVGLSDSYEQYYQAIRRCYRYGQQRVVEAHIVLSHIEAEIAANVQRKELAAGRFTAELVEAMRTAGTWKASA